MSGSPVTQATEARPARAAMTDPAQIRVLDARRLTGLNVVTALPAAVVDIAVESQDAADALFAAWQHNVRDVCAAADWPQPALHHHHFEGGLSLALEAPIDALYAAVDMAEWCARRAIASHLDEAAGPAPVDDAVADFKRMLAEDRKPRLIDMAAHAAERAVALLWDDDEVSLGLGCGARVWPADALPADIDWSGLHNVPVALVTGTNGKTTTVRLASRILRAAGMTVGMSSTDAVVVDDRVIERGDFSGPGGARMVLRQPDVDVAMLETARGGLLRRGLGVAQADVALITNISEDHLGDFGSRNLAELADLKWLVMRALDADGTAVLNADDALSVARAPSLDAQQSWFSLDPDNPVLARRIVDGGPAFSLVDDALARHDGDMWQPICPIASVPVTLDGVARHNVANALAAAALCHALGVDDAAIAAGLQSMQINDNAGRCNLFHIGGVDVLLDFAHNPRAMSALFDIASAHPARRRVLCFGQAGDRTDGQIRELALAAWGIGLERVIVSELAPYYRGREPHEVFTLMRDALLGAGARPEQISHHDTEAQSLDDALAWAQPGDLVIMLALSDARNLLQHLGSLAGS